MLKKGFLRNKYVIEYSKSRLLKSVFVGIISSLFIYSFLCGLRLLFRTIEVGYSNGPYLLDETSRYWQNFNFAMISFAVGNTGFIQTLFRKPSSIKLPNYKRYAILVDQVYLPYNFAHLFFKIFFLMSVFSMSFIDLREFGINIYLYVLLAIVLFLESYKTIIKVYKLKVYKLIFINLLVLILGAFSIANTSIFNYQQIDEKLLSNNPLIELPSSEYESEEHWGTTYFLKVYKSDGELVYYVDNNQIAFKDLPQYILNSRMIYSHYRRPVVNLLISKDLIMEDVQYIQRFLTALNIVKVRYIVDNPKTHIDRFTRRGINRRLPYVVKEKDSFVGKHFPPAPPPSPQSYIDYINKFKIIDLEIQPDGVIIIDGKIITKRNQLIRFFKKRIDSDAVFNFSFVETEITYQEYMDVYSRYRMIVDELRNDYLVELGRPDIEEYDKGYKNIMKEVKSKYPLRYVDNYSSEKNKK